MTTSSVPATTTTTPPHITHIGSIVRPTFDPEVIGGDTCDFCQCCMNPGGFVFTKLSKAFASGATTLQEVFYVVICYGGWTVIFLDVYPAITASSAVASYHKGAGLVVFAMCVLTWRIAKTTSPGNINTATLHQYDNYAYDNLLYHSQAVCPTLHIRKLPRSKYNRYSGTHVPRFDHHCHVLNAAIGERNYRYFLLFLTVHCSMCWYGCTITMRLVWEQVATNTERPTQLPRLVAVLYENPVRTCFGIALGIAGAALAWFGLFHVWLVMTGRTTNEYYKWKEMRATKAILKEERTTTSTSDGSGSYYGDEESRGSVPTKLSRSKGAVVKQQTVNHTNMYDRGVLSNIWEVLSPRCDRPIGKKRD